MSLIKSNNSQTINNNLFKNQYVHIRHKIERKLNTPSFQQAIKHITNEPEILFFPFVLPIDYLAISKLSSTNLPQNLVHWVGLPYWDDLHASLDDISPPQHSSDNFDRYFSILKVYTSLRLFIQEIAFSFITAEDWIVIMNGSISILDNPINIQDKYVQNSLLNEIEPWKNTNNIKLNDNQKSQLFDLIKLIQFEKDVLFQIVKNLHNNVKIQYL